MGLINVHSSIEQLMPSPRMGMGMPCLIMPGTETVYKEYRTIQAFTSDAVMTGVNTNAILLSKLAYVWNQSTRHEKFAILVTADVAGAITKYREKEFYFLLAGADDLTTQKAIATFVDSGQNVHMRQSVLRFDDAASAVDFVRYKNNISAIAPKAKETVLDDEGQEELIEITEHMDAALVAEVGSRTPGSINWKFRRLTGVTPQYLDEDEMAAIDDVHGIAYVFKHNAAQTSAGWQSFKEEGMVAPRYIDNIHGQAWVRLDVERRLDAALRSVDKVFYDDRGIARLEMSLKLTLKEAAAMGIVGERDGLPIYRTQALPVDAQDEIDIVNRRYRGLEYEYLNSGAIDEVWVTGSVTNKVEVVE